MGATYPPLSLNNFTRAHVGAVRVWAREIYASSQSSNLKPAGQSRTFVLEMEIFGGVLESRRMVGVYMRSNKGELTLFQVLMMWYPGNVSLADYRASDYGATGAVERTRSWNGSFLNSWSKAR